MPNTTDPSSTAENDKIPDAEPPRTFTGLRRRPKSAAPKKVCRESSAKSEILLSY